MRTIKEEALADDDLPLRVVLVEPITPGNVGAVARAMANFGARDLAMVFPKGEPEGMRGEEAFRRARWAAPILEGAMVATSLTSALAGCGAIYGSSSHPWDAMGVVGPEAFGRIVGQHAMGRPAGLVLGREDRGLCREEQVLCSGVVQIPTHGAYPDLNLSHAASLLLYEARKAILCRDLPPPVEAPEFQDMQQFYGELEALLFRIDFLKPETGPAFTRKLRAWVGRKDITPAELSVLRGMVHRVNLALERRQPGR